MSKWEMVRLGDMCDIKGGKRIPKGYGYAKKPTSYPYIRVVDFAHNSVRMDGLVYITDDVASMIKRYTISSSDVYISIAGTIGVVGTVPDTLNNAHLTENAAKLVIRNSDVLDKKYLVSVLSAPIGQRQISTKIMSTSQPKLALFRIEEIEIPLPPLDMQQKIAGVLNHTNALIEKRKVQITNLDLLIKSQFIEMFGDPVTNPMGWDVVRLGDIVKIRSSKRVYQSEQTPSGVPFLRISDLVSKIVEGIDICDLYISNELYENLKQTGFVPKAMDILVTSRGTLGLCYIVSEADRFYFQDGMISWLDRREDNINPVYLAHFFQSEEIKRQIVQVASGSTVNYLSLSNMADFKILCPPHKLQNRYESFVLQIKNEKLTMQNGLDRLSVLYKSLMQKYFEGEMFNG